MFGDLLAALIPGLSGVEKLSAVGAAFAATVTDGKMWRSLGWLLLGVALMWWALMLLLRHQVEPKLAAAAKLAAL